MLTRIEVQVGDDWESGTDCTVYFALKNQGTTETCQTGPLDGPGNDWAESERECYRTGFKLMVTLQSGCVPEILTLCRIDVIFF